MDELVPEARGACSSNEALNSKPRYVRCNTFPSQLMQNPRSFIAVRPIGQLPEPSRERLPLKQGDTASGARGSNLTPGADEEETVPRRYSIGFPGHMGFPPFEGA